MYLHFKPFPSLNSLKVTPCFLYLIVCVTDDILDEGTELCDDNGLRDTSIELFLDLRLAARTILERCLLS
jgi:hypothetical protein